MDGRFTFVLFWVMAWFAASQLESAFSHLVRPLHMSASIIVYLTLFAAMQALLVRHLLLVRLRGWVALSALGAVLGHLGYHLAVHAMGAQSPAWVKTQISRGLPDDYVALALTLWHIAAIALTWFGPAAMQWLALRKRFRLHWLWLLTTLSAVLLSYRLEASAYDWLIHFIAVHLNSVMLATVALQLVFAIPPALMAFVLYHIVKAGGRNN